MHLSRCSSSQHALSCIIDTTHHLFGEVLTSVQSLFPYSLLFGVGKFSGPCYVFTCADSDEFWSSIGVDHHHQDGIYGWSMVIENPVSQVPLPGRHAAMFGSQETVYRMAEAVMSLYRLSPNRPPRERNIAWIIMVAWWSVSKLLCQAALRSINKLLSFAYKVSHGAISGLFKLFVSSHISRDASSLAVPQEDSMCGDGPTVKQGRGTEV